MLHDLTEGLKRSACDNGSMKIKPMAWPREERLEDSHSMIEPSLVINGRIGEGLSTVCKRNLWSLTTTRLDWEEPLKFFFQGVSTVRNLWSLISRRLDWEEPLKFFFQGVSTEKNLWSLIPRRLDWEEPLKFDFKATRLRGTSEVWFQGDSTERNLWSLIPTCQRRTSWPQIKSEIHTEPIANDPPQETPTRISKPIDSLI